MATKSKKTETTIIYTTAKKVLGLATKVNDFALSTTEKAALKSIDLTEKGLGFSNTVVKRGLKVSAKQQDVIFNTLDTVKGKVVKFIPKFK